MSLRPWEGSHTPTHPPNPMPLTRHDGPRLSPPYPQPSHLPISPTHSTGIMGLPTPPLTHTHTQTISPTHSTGIMGLSFGDYSLCDSEFSCFPPLIDDLVRPYDAFVHSLGRPSHVY